jgi:Mrp family chromosome partitioning ATPase
VIIGPRISRRFGRRGRRLSAAERAGGRMAVNLPDVGSWRRQPPTVAASHIGHTPPAILRAAIAPPAETPKPAPSMLAIGPVETPLIALDPGPERQQPALIGELGPACAALSATAFAPAASRRARLILVTSPTAREGKSFTSVNLAQLLAQSLGRPVLLVDGDTQTAGTARALGWPPRPGLSELLAGDARPEEVIRPTGLDELSFLPPGGPLAALPKLLASRRLSNVLRALLMRQPAGLVLIDGPPLLTGIAAPALATYAGQVILLVGAGRTTRQAIDDSLSRLGERDGLHCIFTRSGPAANA